MNWTAPDISVWSHQCSRSWKIFTIHYLSLPQNFDQEIRFGYTPMNSFILLIKREGLVHFHQPVLALLDLGTSVEWKWFCEWYTTLNDSEWLCGDAGHISTWPADCLALCSWISVSLYMFLFSPICFPFQHTDLTSSESGGKYSPNHDSC